VLFISFLGIVNTISYLLMVFDKSAAKQNKRRIPENSLWLITILGGSLGTYLGMKAPLFHKAAKPMFKIGVPIVIIFQLIVAIYILNKYGYLV
jgi:uncharacterized membrane protein YsdA (DUF1294 family)